MRKLAKLEEGWILDLFPYFAECETTKHVLMVVAKFSLQGL
jgi:hypothetical protein